MLLLRILVYSGVIAALSLTGCGQAPSTDASNGSVSKELQVLKETFAEVTGLTASDVPAEVPLAQIAVTFSEDDFAEFIYVTEERLQIVFPRAEMENQLGTEDHSQLMTKVTLQTLERYAKQRLQPLETN